MRCVGGREIGEAKEIHGGGMKRRRMQNKDSMMHTWRHVGIILRRILTGLKA